jgi:LacI family transcriptional regulator
MAYQAPTQYSDRPKSATRHKSITLKDVALRAGVASMSVSAVLNGSESTTRVSEATRQRILEAASELGYRKNLSAAAARSGRFGNIAFVMSSESNRTFLSQDLIVGINEELARHDLLMTMVQLPDDRLVDADFVPNILRKLSCDGLILDYCSMIPQALIELIERFAIPAVWINVERSTNSVYPDDEQAAFDATEHLIKLGHQRICHITSSASAHESVANRRRGYERAMKLAGYAPRVEGMDPRESPRPLFERMKNWFTDENAPTSFFAYEAEYVLPVWMVSEKMERSVPEDVSLVAIHDREVRLLGSQLTCWEIPVLEMGRASVRMLLRQIENPFEECESIKLSLCPKLGETCHQA